MSAYEKLKADFPCNPEVVTTAVFQEHLLKLVVLPVTFGNPILYEAIEQVIDAIKDGDRGRRSKAGKNVRNVAYRDEADALAGRAAAFVALAFGELEKQREFAASACFETAECHTVRRISSGRSSDLCLTKSLAWVKIHNIATRATFKDQDLDEGFIDPDETGPLH